MPKFTNESRDYKNPDTRVLEYLRSISEVDLCRKIVDPLLRQIGSNVQYVHGNTEEGKDFIFTTKDAYGDLLLEVCQVKNAPFSSKAGHRSNLITLLQQLTQCKNLEVTNPATHLNELPQFVSLITTYPLPQKGTKSAGILLNKLKQENCKIIGPDKFLFLLKTYLPKLYNSLAYPGAGISKSLLIYVNTHHESMAFGIDQRRPLPSFYVDLGISGHTFRTEDAEKKLPRKSDIHFETYMEILNFQKSMPPEVRIKKILTGKAEKVTKRIKVEDYDVITQERKEKEQEIVLENVRIESNAIIGIYNHIKRELERLNANKTMENNHKALQLIFGWMSLISFIMRNIPNNHFIFRDLKNASSLIIENFLPQSVVNARESISILGDAGAGKTSIARTIARFAIEKGIKCIYFPCYLTLQRRFRF